MIGKLTLPIISQCHRNYNRKNEQKRDRFIINFQTGLNNSTNKIATFNSVGLSPTQNSVIFTSTSFRANRSTPQPKTHTIK